MKVDLEALNRAFLARQMLLERAQIPVATALERLVGMQAQAPDAPYFGLWNRLEHFHQEQLSQLLKQRQAVRIALMRSTIHLVSADDCLQLRPAVQPVLEKGLKHVYGKQLQGLDMAQIAKLGRLYAEQQAMTFQDIGKNLSEQWPQCDPAALAAAVRTMVPLVQVPPRGIWGESGRALHTSAEAWLGQPLAGGIAAEKLVLRYLAAYGPASLKDFQAWSGLTGFKETWKHLRPNVYVFQDESGNELYDLPDAPRPEGTIDPAPRFIGEFDNILLSHSDRTRIIDEDDLQKVITRNGIVRSTILVRGFVAGIWSIEQDRNSALLRIEPFRKLSRAEKEGLIEEGRRMLEFAGPDKESRKVTFL